LHDTPNAQANPAIATAITQRSERGYEAEIHLLAPSRHPPGLLDNVGKPMDGDYFFRLVVHEYSTVFLEQIRRRAGWRHAPDWFVQGYEEWLGLTRSTDRNRTERLDRYRKILKEDPARIDFSFGIDVREPYVDGVVLLDFLHAEFGRKRVQAILASPEPSFGRAMRKELGVGLSEMERRFVAWRKRL
ncbi:MAG TPA: hypothetical protein VEJ18_15975, partial [Planctomycetota bacterium]|nr:hypothetical protein [Planctomycetota bacterium]